MAAHERYSKVGPYILMETLGVGSFGKVKLAVHSTTYARYACKILDKSLVRERVLSLQVQKEIDIMQRLTHRNTVSLVSVLSTSSKVFIVMELVTGGELFDEILRHKRLSEPYARFYFRQLIEGLQHCHEHGVYHRDLKPENLLLDDNKTLKITDFGLSTLKAGGASTTESVTGSLTLHTQCGTPNYVAPEIITLDADGYSGAKVDAWSCGIILYVLVAGALPFDANEMDVLFKLILRCDLTYPPFFSPALVDLISNLLKTNPAERYSLADVKQHSWYNGPVETAMDGDEPSLPSTLPSTLTPTSSSQSPTSVSTDNAHDAVAPPPANFVSGQASLLSQFKIEPPQDQAPPPPLISRKTDSLDFGIRAESVESELAVPSMPPNPRHLDSAILPAAISERGANGEDIADQAIVADQPRPDCAPDSNLDPLDRFRSRVLGSSESSFVQSSDDDHESEFEDAEELRVPDGFFGPRTREAKGAQLSRKDVTVRRVHSLNNLSSADDELAAKRGGTNNIGHDEDGGGGFGIRRRIKRQLWDRAAETWRIPAQSYHVSKTTTLRFDKDEAKASALDFDRKVIDFDYSSGISGNGVVREWKSMGKDAFFSNSAYTEEAIPRKRSSITGATSTVRRTKHVRANSHDGTMTVPPTRRRPRSRHSSTGQSKAVPALPRSQGVTQKPEHVQVAKAKQRSVKRIRRTVDKDLKNPDGAKPRHQPGTVQFRDVKREPPQPRSAFRPDKDWVKNDLGKMLWCRMMKDYDMMPDDDEFEMDSLYLNEIWTAGLAKENLGRKDSFAASRFGSPTFVPSRSTQYLSSQASRSEAKRWQASKRSPHKPNGGNTRGFLHNTSPSSPVGSGSSSPNSANEENDSGRMVAPHIAPKPARRMTEKDRSNTPSPEQVGHPITARPISPMAAPSSTENGYPAHIGGKHVPMAPNIPSKDMPVREMSVPRPEVNGPVVPLSPVPVHMVKEGAPAVVSAAGRVNGRAHIDGQDENIIKAKGTLSAQQGRHPQNRSLLQAACVDDAGVEDHVVEKDEAMTTGAEAPPSGVERHVSKTVTSQRRNTHGTTDVNVSEGSGTLSSSSMPANRDSRQSGSRGKSEAASEARSDAKLMYSDRATASSPMGSVSSVVMGSRGSDLMSTPRDPEKSYSEQVGGDHANGYSSGASRGSDLEPFTDEITPSGNASVSAPNLPHGIDEISQAGRSQSTGSRPRPPKLTNTKSAADGNGDPVSPFSLDIPGPRGKSLPAGMPLIGLLPGGKPAKPLLKKAFGPLHVKSYTQFHSLLEPVHCFNVMQELLRDYGCSIVKGSVTKAGERFRIKCESKKGSVTVAATIVVYKLDDSLCAVLFKKRGKTDGQQYLEFYSDMHKRYCDKSKSMEVFDRDGIGGSRRRSRRTRNHVRFGGPISAAEAQTLTSQSVRSGQGSSLRTESSDSAGTATPGIVRKGDIECVTPTM